MDALEERKIWRYANHELQPVVDCVTSEKPLTIQLNGQELATLVSSPHERKELVVGFLATEGFIKTKDDIRGVLIDEREGIAWVDTKEQTEQAGQLFLKRYLTSCCGRSRPNFYFANDALIAKKVESCYRLQISAVFTLIQCIESELFAKTGGVHGGGLCQGNNVLHYSFDTGRHNVMDKLYGWGLMNDIDFANTCIVFSGRISSEILLKVSKMGVPILASRSAPMGLAVDLAEELGITVAGFVRDGKMNIYTYPERLEV